MNNYNLSGTDPGFQVGGGGGALKKNHIPLDPPLLITYAYTHNTSMYKLNL